MNQKDQDDLNCVKQIRCGGEQRNKGLALLYSNYGAKIIGRYQNNYGMSKEQAEDMLHNVFEKIIRKIDTYAGEGKFSSWLWRIVDREFINEIRKISKQPKIKQPVIADPDTEVDPDPWPQNDPAPPIELDLRKCVHQAFLRFTNGQVERAYALEQTALNGWDMKSLAYFLGRTPGATREYVSQIRKKLEPFLEPCREFLDDLRSLPSICKDYHDR